MNIDLLKPFDSPAKKYKNLLHTFNLTQHVEKATRTTQVSETLIDHIISNDPKRVTYTNVLPCSNVSDHHGPHAYLNIRAERFVPRIIEAKSSLAGNSPYTKPLPTTIKVRCR